MTVTYTGDLLTPTANTSHYGAVNGSLFYTVLIPRHFSLNNFNVM